MASTVKAITAVSLETMEKLSNYENWTAFLSSAAWQFKYPFADQILIYAQRPHATACGTFEFWHENKSWYRWIRKGVEGIALLRETNKGYKLEYVYDVSDTRSMDGKRFYLWQYDSRLEDAVIETLENTFGELTDKTTLEDAIINAARIAVEDSKADYLAELKYAKENSFLEDLDEFNIDVEFQRIAEASVAFMIMQRLNLKPQEIFEREDFQAIADFNTPEVINVLGSAVSSIAEQGIREISKTVIAEKRKLREQEKFFAKENNPVYNNDKQEELNDNENMERNDESVSTDNLHSDRRLQVPELDSSDTQQADRQIRQTSENISDEREAVSLFDDVDKGTDSSTSVGDRRASERASERIDGSDGTGQWSERGNEGERPDEMDGTNEQYSPFSGGNRASGVGVQLSFLLPTEEEQINSLEQRKAERDNRSAFSLSQEEIDAVLQEGSDFTHGKYRIYELFTGISTLKERADFLKKEYGHGGKGFTFADGTNGYVSSNGKGIHISKYNDMLHPDIILNWETVAKHIGNLVAYDRYLSPEEKEKYPAYKEMMAEYTERKEIADEMRAIVREYDETKAESSEAINRYACIGAIGRFQEDRTSFHGRKKEGESVTAILMDGFNTIIKNEPEKYSERIGLVIKRAIPYLDIPNVEKQQEEYDLSAVIEQAKQILTKAEYVVDDEIINYAIDHKLKNDGVTAPNAEQIAEAYEQVLIDNEKDNLSSLSSYDRYKHLKEENPDSVVIVQLGDFYEFYDKDAEIIAELRDLHITGKVTASGERVSMCGVPAHALEANIEALQNNGYAVVVNSIDTDTGEITINHYDSNVQQEKEPTIREIFDEYAPLIVSKVLNDEAYVNACYNSDEQNAKLECDEAVKRAVMSLPFEENASLHKLYYDMAEFHRRLESHAFEKTYELILYEKDLPVYDRETEIIGDILSAIGRNDVQMEFDDNGIVGVAPDKRMAGQEIYQFLINEVLLDIGGLNLFKLTDKNLNDFRDLMFHHGMEDAYNKAVEIRIPKEIRDIGKPQTAPEKPQSNTYEHRNYVLLKKLAPEILSKESSYIHFVAGSAIMPLTVEHLSGNRIAVSHYYKQDGDSIADPDMEFVFDNENETLTAVSFQQGSFYQTTETPNGINKTLERELNSFANQWFRNNDSYGFVKEVQKVKWQDETIELTFNKDGDITSIVGTQETVSDYVKTHNLDLVQISTDTYGILAPSAPEEEQSEEIPEVEADGKRNFHIVNDNIGHGTKEEKYEANVAAIRTLKQIESENRLATPEEQEILSGYVGWGGLDSCFDENNKHYAELKELLTEEEYTSANASVLTAFYTPPVIMRSMYKALDNMGFKTGNILDPSCGTGHFMGTLPDSMQDSKMYGVELDSISGRIARQLYQKNNIEIRGYEDSTLPNSYFDVAIGNVPFGGYKVFDSEYNKHNFLIHDYFFAKSIDKVRSGGVIAFITTNGIGGGTMDKADDRVRRYIAERCDLIGVVRLPINAFSENAGTKTNTDIVFLQKLDYIRNLEEDAPDWIDTDVFYENDYTDNEGNTTHNVLTINKYFTQHPEMVLGNLEVISGPYGPQLVCQPNNDTSLAEQLGRAIENLEAEIPEYDIESSSDYEVTSIPADPDVKNFSFTLVDGEIYFRENGLMHKVDVNKTAQNRIKGLIELRDCTHKLIDLQLHDATSEEITAQQAELNRLYDAYVQKYDRINSRGNEMAFSDDGSYYLLCSLEVNDKKGNFERKADMFTKRTIKNYTPVQSVETAVEALEVSISERACVDMGFMSSLSGKTFDELEEDLQGVIFRDIKCPTDVEKFVGDDEMLHKYLFVTADEYLSGDVRLKLKMAEAMREAQPDHKKHLVDANIAALKEVQPKDLEASEIAVRLGTHWIPTDIYRQFIFDLLETPEQYQDDINVLYSDITGDWNVTGKSADRSDNVRANVTYGTSRVNAYWLIQDCLRFKNSKVYDKDRNGNPIINETETAAAQERQELIREAFKDWIWKDPDRREKLTKFYNETMNNIRPREYDGSHIKFVGMNPEITLLPHQRDAVARGIYGGNTLLAHCVGAGKTYEMTGIAMESKRLGLCQKSMFVVPNALVGQWAAEIYSLYPAANILVATKKDFEAKNRKKFCARIATGNYDAVIIGHSQLVKIPISYERQVALLQHEIHEISEGIKRLKIEKNEGFSVKQLEKTKKNLLDKLKRLTEAPKKDNVVSFEQLGVDKLFIDESDEFKNLYLYSKMTDVAGITQGVAQKATDLYMKCRYMDELTDYKGNVHATGTPVSNSMVELYTIQRYLQYNELEKRGLVHFDAWAAQFGETVTAMELAPEGTGYRMKTRFAKFNNLPELMAMFKEVADIKTSDMLDLPVPEKELINVKVVASAVQKEYVSDLADRAEDVRDRKVKPYEDNMLKITNDGRKLALDQRLVNPLYHDEEISKINTAIGNIYEIWNETIADRCTQLVFCDLSTPTQDHSFNVYDDIRDKLVSLGVPREEIAFIHEANTETKREELFAAVKCGDVRVLIGSTKKMGAGMNVQDRLIALHNLDCPWRPRDMEQRMGRIVRRGNMNKKVRLYQYVTEDTFDSYNYQILENKQRFISQIMTSKSPARSADDIDSDTLTYAEVKALATGNPLIKEKMELETIVQKLRVSRNNYENQHYRLEDAILKFIPSKIATAKGKIAVHQKDLAFLNEYKEKNPLPEKSNFYGMTIQDVQYSEKADAGKALLEALEKHRSLDEIYIGEYMGFALYAKSSPYLLTEHKLIIRKNTSYELTLGDDIYGNIQRIDNALSGIGDKISYWKNDLKENEKALEQSKIEFAKPFDREEEYQAHTARLAELNALLTVKKEKPIIDTSISEEDVSEQDKKRNKELER